MDRTRVHHRLKSSSIHGDANDDDYDRPSFFNQQDDDENDERFNEKLFDPIPWKGIILAFILMMIGIFIIVVYVCSRMGWIAFQPNDNFTFLTLAFITLVPGFYHCFIAFRAYRGYEGYSFDDIADLN